MKQESDPWKTKVESMFNLFFVLKEGRNTKFVVDLIRTDYLNRGIIFCGVGKNWYICEKLYKTAISLGIMADALDPVHALHGDCGMIQNQMIFFLSKSGTTKELITLAKYLIDIRKKGIMKPFMVGVFLDANTPLDEFMDLSLVPPEGTKLYEFDSKDIIPTLSINIMQMYMDYLLVEVFNQCNDLKERYRFNHPGGKIGEQLDSRKLLT